MRFAEPKLTFVASTHAYTPPSSVVTIVKQNPQATAIAKAFLVCACCESSSGYPIRVHVTIAKQNDGVEMLSTV